ncbi:MAG: PAS domain S-box protein, partial [Candidatus Eremiobacteraeota bacterium]|nr:PAS domain S-box protein [Candidatus Eremiobacteraeota bacterium]
MLDTTAARNFSPFPDPGTVQMFRIGSGALFLEGRSNPSMRLLEMVTLALERLDSEREMASLRQKVKRLGKQLKAVKRSSHRLLPELENTERRAGALSAWYRHAAQMLASSHLGSSLPGLVERAKALLEVEFGAVLTRELKRVRLWGGESLRRVVGSTFDIKRLGSIGRRVLLSGDVYNSGSPKARFESSKLFGSIGLKSLLAVPMKVEGRVLGAFLLGSEQEHEFLSDEIDLARLMAYQSALFLENALLVSGADVERVVARAVLESMADGVFTLDWEKRITSFNPAAEHITGWKAEDAVGRRCSEVMRGQYLCPGAKKPAGCEENCPLLALLADQELMETGLTVEGTIKTANGEPRYVSSSYSVVADRGDLLGAVVLFRDITEKKALEQMKSDYAAALSHDLKTPLTAMKGYAVTLLRHGEKLDEETRHEALEVINSEIDRVTRMFDNLLHQARIEAGMQTRYLEPIDLHEAIGKVVSLHNFSSRKHSLKANVPEGLMVRGDRDQLDQILNNLVSNAVKYSPAGCHIMVRAEADDRFARVEVEDDGPGIPEDQIPYVFERFR